MRKLKYPLEYILSENIPIAFPQVTLLQRTMRAIFRYKY